jgi:VanZ family protein
VSFPKSHSPRLPGGAIVDSERCFPWPPSSEIQHTLLGAICAFVLSSILVAGLWPFHAPKNEVSWLSKNNGLFFGKYGSIVSAGFLKARSRADSSCTLEIWLQPSRVDSTGTILAFYWPASRIVAFALRQSLGDLQLERKSQDQSAKRATVYIEDVFSRPKSVFVTISSSQTGTTIYVDGILVRKSSDFRFSSQDLTGEVIIGNAPSTTDTWSGQVNGLAVYDRELLTAEVSRHFAAWTKSRVGGLAKSESLVAIYLFNEGNGNVVHNQADSATNLLIPERFFVLREQFLERPWDEFRPDWHYLEDVAINIGGFIPLGFFFCAYLSVVRKIKKANWLTIALGFAVSLTIEVLQALLPTRDSGMTDLVTNTFGTALGTVLCAWIRKYNWPALVVGLSVFSR